MNTAARPRFFYGWIVVGGVSLTEVVSWGILYYAFGVLMPAMQAELGWSRAQLAGAFSTGLLASALIAIPLGRYVDRHGARGVMTLGSCAGAALVAAWSQVESLAAFYIIWIGLGLSTACVLYEPAFALVVAWFTRRRAEALALITSVGGLASTVWVPIITWLALRLSWRTTLLILAVILAVVTIPIHAWVVRSRPADLGLLPDGTTHDPGNPLPHLEVVARMPDHVAPQMEWLLAVTFGLTTLSSAAAAVHVIPFLLARGHSAQRAAFVMALIGVAQVPGRVLFSSLMRWLPNRWLAPLVFLLQASGIACLAVASSTMAALVTFAVLFGAGNGLTTVVRPTLVADWFGSARYGAVSGTVAFCGQLSRAAGPIVAAWLVTGFGTYEGMWATLALSVGAGAVLILIVPHRAARTSPPGRTA